MTRYSRSVIPGRASGEPLSQEIDSLVFGRKGRVANDEDDDLDEAETNHLVKRANADRRSKAERRSPKGRRQADFAPLPGEGRGLRAEGSKRGPILLVGAAVVVAVFGVVVWNAYREGVRPQDSNTAPRLAEAGAFKSKPAAVVDEPSTAVEASVFEQVEARKPAVEPAPEVREEPKPAPAAVATPVTPPLPSRAFEKPVQGPTQTAAPAKPVPTPAKTAPQPAAAAPAATQPAAAKPTAAKPTATKPTAAKPTAAKPAGPVAPPVQPVDAPEPAAVSLIGAGTYAPAFAADGKYVVQVAAASSEAGANAEWARRARAMPELFPAAAEKIIVQADVDGRTVYRVRVGAFASAADADAFCSAIKAKGGACFRTVR